MKRFSCACAAFLTIAGSVRAASPTPSTAYQWSNVAMGGAGFVSGVFAHPGKQGLFYARTDVGGIYRYNPSNESWVPLLDGLPPERGSHMGIESLALNPKIPSSIHLLAGTPYWRGGTGILSSSNFGDTWQTTDVSTLIRAHGNKWGRHTGERLAIDPNFPTILFCGSRESGLWKSIDAGKTWIAVDTFSPGATIPLKADPKKSQHPASTANGNGISFVIIDPHSGSQGQASRTIYVGLSRPRVETRLDGQFKTPDGNLYQSTDGGATWRVLPPLPNVGVSGSKANEAWVSNRAILAKGRLIVTYQAEGKPGGGVFRYDPKQDQWADITPGSISNKPENKGQFVRTYNPYCGIDIVETEPTRLVVSTMGTYWPQKNLEGKTLWGERIYYSHRGADEDGSTWIDVFGSDKARVHSDIPFGRRQNIHWGASVALDPFNPDRAFITSGNGIWHTNDLQKILTKEKDVRATWKLHVTGLEEAVPMDVASIPEGPLVSVIWDYAGFTNDSPETYSPHGQFREAAGLNVRLAFAGKGSSAQVIRVNSGGELAYSKDSGKSWVKLPATGLGKAGTNAHLALSSDGCVILYSPANKKVYRNEAPSHQWLPENWVEVTDLENANRPVADPVQAKVFHAYRHTTGEILRSEDGGKSFKPVSKPGVRAYNIVAAPERDSDLWIPADRAGIIRSHQGTHEKIPVFHCGTLGFGRARDQGQYPTLFIWGRPLEADPQGIYRSTDIGKTWLRVDDDSHQYGGLGNGYFVKGDMNVFGRVYRSSPGRGIPFGTPAN
jgi:xyloglucan-specific exo-beta-1,4-glucanase